MSERWVIGVDGSIGSRTALEWALQQGNRLDAALVAVHAYPTSIPQRAKALVARDDSEPGRAAMALAELEASISDLVDDRHVERVVADGHAGRALLAASHRADLIVVGRHGSGGGWHDVIGSTSRYCVTHSSIPTVVVPSDWNHGGLERIVVGFDGSDNAAAAVRWAVDFAPRAATVRALIALEVAPWLPGDVVRLRLEDELRQEEQRITCLLDDVDPHGLVEREIVVRGARPALARAAEYVDLVVLGQRGAGALSSLVVGSVSTWMLDAAPTPIAVVPLPA